MIILYNERDRLKIEVLSIRRGYQIGLAFESASVLRELAMDCDQV